MSRLIIEINKDAEECFVGYLAQEIERAQKDMEAFTKRMSANPAYAFEWSKEAFDAAGRIEVYSIIKAQIENGESVELTIARVYLDMIRAAASPASSSSAQSNMTDLCRNAARARLLEVVTEIKRNKPSAD